MNLSLGASPDLMENSEHTREHYCRTLFRTEHVFVLALGVSLRLSFLPSSSGVLRLCPVLSSPIWSPNIISQQNTESGLVYVGSTGVSPHHRPGRSVHRFGTPCQTQSPLSSLHCVFDWPSLGDSIFPPSSLLFQPME